MCISRVGDGPSFATAANKAMRGLSAVMSRSGTSCGS
jgi:hypothetical protein